MSVRVKTGRYSEPRTYHVQIVREPNLLPTLVMAVLTNAIDTEGNLPEELTARIKATIQLKGHDPIELRDTLSGPRYTGPMGPAALFSPMASIVNILVRNPMAPVRIESIDCDVEIAAGPHGRHHRVGPPGLRPRRAGPDPQGVRHAQAVQGRAADGRGRPAPSRRPPRRDLRGELCDMTNSLRRRFRNEPSLLEPRDLDGPPPVDPPPDRAASGPRSILHVPAARPRPGRPGPGAAEPPRQRPRRLRHRPTEPGTPVRADLIEAAETPWVVEGTQALKFTVVKDAGLSLK